MKNTHFGTPNNILLYSYTQWLPQPPSEKLPLAVVGTQTKAHTWTMDRVRDLRTHSPKWGVFIKPSPQASGIYVEVEAERLEEPEVVPGFFFWLTNQLPNPDTETS